MQLPGALALAAAGASTQANAATVQITFNDSYISTTAGNHLDTDVGGDGTADFAGAARNVSYQRFAYFGKTTFRFNPGGGNAWYANAGWQAPAIGGRGAFANAFGEYAFGDPAILRTLIQFTITDANVRGGAFTSGWVDLTLTGRNSGEAGRIDVHRFIFDDATGAAPDGVTSATTGLSEWSAVPEPSSLALLALGAGGLLARRRRVG